jgi:hypothetical protein
MLSKECVSDVSQFFDDGVPLVGQHLRFHNHFNRLLIPVPLHAIEVFKILFDTIQPAMLMLVQGRRRAGDERAEGCEEEQDFFMVGASSPADVR